MSLLEQLFAYGLLAGAAAMAVFAAVTWQRGWFRNVEENEMVYRKDHPRSFAVLQLLQIAAVGILLYVGWRALGGWK